MKFDGEVFNKKRFKCTALVLVDVLVILLSVSVAWVPLEIVGLGWLR